MDAFFRKFKGERLFRLSTEDFTKWMFLYFKKQGFKVSNDFISSNPLHDLRIEKDGKRHLVYGRYWKRELTGLEDIEVAYQDMRENYSDDCVVITSGTFTPQAWEYAQNRPIQLIDCSLFVQRFREQTDLVEFDCSPQSGPPKEQGAPTNIHLRPDQKAKQESQSLAKEMWASEEFKHLNISQMARELRKREPAKRYSDGIVRKWAREVAPVEKRDKRGRPKK